MSSQIALDMHNRTKLRRASKPKLVEGGMFDMNSAHWAYAVTAPWRWLLWGLRWLASCVTETVLWDEEREHLKPDKERER